MKFLSRKSIAAVAGLAGLTAMLLMPVASQANCWRCYPHRWHPAGRWSRMHNCRRTYSQRYCRWRNGHQQCYTVSRSRFVCVY